MAAATIVGLGTPPDGTADVVYGQLGSFTTADLNKGATAGNASDQSLAVPGGVTVDKFGNVYVADTGNHRVLFYEARDPNEDCHQVPCSPVATRVYGQNGSLTANDSFGTPTANSLSSPEGVALDSLGRLYVADRGNNRVLVYEASSTTATIVYGQGSFSGRAANRGSLHATQNGLSAPFAVALDQHDNLYIADRGNHRVVFYRAGNNSEAERQYGQPDFDSPISGLPPQPPTATSLNAPYGVAVDKAGNLYVADRDNVRVLFFENGNTTATRVYGQAGNFTTRNAGTAADKLGGPEGVGLDRQGNLWVADRGNNRVLFFPDAATTASQVYGQSTFTDGTPKPASVTTLNAVKSVSVDRQGNLYVADVFHHRVLEYRRPPDGIEPRAAPTQTPPANATGWNNTNVVVHWNWSDDSAGTGVDEESCTFESTSNGEGSAITLTADCRDYAGNLGTASYTVKVDKTAPGSAISQSPGANAAGWNNSDVTVTWNWTDEAAGSGLDLTHCQASSTLTAEGNPVSATATCQDVAGNVASEMYSARLDKTSPVASPAQSPLANAAGWNNTDVNVEWNWADGSGSGIDAVSCAASRMSTGVGSAVNVTATCTDRAGNPATASYSVRVDKTAPTRSAVTQLPLANGAGWNNGDVTVTWTWADATSGVDAARCTTAGTSSGEGTAVAVPASCTDLAGNTASDTYSLKVDKTRPAASPVQSPLANAAGWNNSDVTVTWNWGDAGGSGVDTVHCPTTSVSSGVGNPLTVTGICTDVAGNTASTPYSVRVDKTAPAPSAITQLPLPNAAGWNNSDVAVTWTWGDAASGVDAVQCTNSRTSSGEGGAIAVSATCADRAGNSALSTASVKVDKTSPSVSLVAGPSDGQTYNFGSVPPAPGCSALDALSGLEGACVVSGYSAALGTHTVTASAVDRAGNAGTASVTYTVSSVATAWTLSGFYDPVDMAGVWNVLKGGSTVPLKFEVFAGSTELTDIGIVNQLRATEVSCTGGQTDDVELVATGGTVLRYDTAAGQFVYNWQTPKRAGYCYVVAVTTTDGSTLSANFRLR
ncbi:MAG TPA: PxKF domain-containing protein [Vicinamibacterales bacterium]|nr:PxKF domain-containing protein [Vicinamibacterales bacterium]